jgi:hypothetical protein
MTKTLSPDLLDVCNDNVHGGKNKDKSFDVWKIEMKDVARS